MKPKNKILKLGICLISVLILFLAFPITAQESVTLNPPDPGCTGSGGFVNLTWTSTIIGTPTYYVLRKIQGEGTYTQIGSTQDTFYPDNNIVSDKNYYYQIKAVGGAGDIFSNQVLAEAVYCPPTLSPPTNSCGSDGPHIHLSWSSISGDLLIYKIYRDGVKIGETQDTNFNDGPNIEGTGSYNYFIKAVWQNGTSRDSDAVNVAVPACPPTLNVSTNCLTNIPGGPGVGLSWNNLLGVQNYKIYRKAQGESEYSLLKTLTGTNYQDYLVESLPDTYFQGGQIFYYVKASWQTNQADSIVSQIEIPRCPPFLTVESNCDEFSFRLSWTTTMGASHYNIYRNGKFLFQKSGATNTSSDYLDVSNCPGKICSYAYYIEAVVLGLPNLSSNSVTKNIDCTTIVSPSPPPNLNNPEAFCAAGDSRISLSWASSNNVTYYSLYRNSTEIMSLLETSYIDSGVQSRVEYIYYVRAFGSSGTSVSSENSKTITAVDCTPPSVPTLYPSSGCYQGNPYVNLSWTETSNTTGYEIYRGPSAVSLSLRITFDKNSPEFSTRTWQDTSVSFSTTYYYKVVSKGPTGVPPSNSTVKSVTTLSCPPTVPIFVLNKSCSSGSPVNDLSWSTNANNTTRYEIFRQDYSPTTPIKIIYDTSVKNWQDAGVLPDTTYNYKVEAVGYLDTIRSTEGYKSITTYNCAFPGAFVLSEPSVYCQGSYPRADLSWTNSSNSTSYNLLRNWLNPDNTIAKTDTLSNVTSVFTDKGFAKALSFDGSNDYVKIPDSSSLRVTGDLTISFWAYPTNISQARQNPLGKAYGGEFSLTMETDGRLSYYHGTSGQDSSPNIDCKAANMFFNNTLVHIVVVRNIASKTITFYKNSVSLPSSCTSWINPVSSTNYLKIGYGYVGYWKGLIDEVRIYNKALNSSEVSQLYQGSYDNNTNLVGFWHFDEGQGQIVSDSSNYGNNGTLGSSSATESSDPVWLDNGLQFGTKYSWQTRAIGPGGNTLSNTTNPTQISCEPTKPGLFLTPFCQPSIGPAVTLSWSYSTNTQTYEIYRDSNLIKTIIQANPEFSSRTWTDNNGGLGLSPATSYTYYIKAISPTGSVNQSDSIATTTPTCTLPPQPQNLTTIFSCGGAGGSYPQITISWDDSENATSYTIYRNGVSLISLADDSNSRHQYIDSGFITEPTYSSGTTYSYYVIAYGPAGGSSPSEQKNVTTDYCLPSVPLITLLTTNCEALVPVNNISWSDATTYNTTGYKIYRDTVNTPPADPIITITSAMPEFSLKTWKDTSVSPLTTYYYWLKAAGPSGESSFSSSKTISTYNCGIIPDAPVLSYTTFCAANLPYATLSWTNSANAYSYNLYRTNPDASNSTYPTQLSPFTEQGSFALNFDGTTKDYIDFGKHPEHEGMSQLTLAAWVKPTGATFTDNYNIFSKANSAYRLRLASSSGKIWYYLVNKSGALFSYTSTKVANLNQWNHVVLTYNGREIRLYHNGVDTNEPKPFSGDINVPNNILYIGTYTGTSEFFNGLIDEARIYNRALTAQEIQDQFQGIYNNETGLVGAWHFDESSGSIVYDKSGKGINGTIKNYNSSVWKNDGPAVLKVLPLERSEAGNPKQYKYSVRAIGANTKSPFSNEVVFNAPFCMPAKPNLRLSSKCEGATPYLLLEWDSDPESLTEYWSIYKKRVGESIFTHFLNVSPPTIFYRDDDVESDLTYEYYLEAVGSGVSVYSDTKIQQSLFCYDQPSKPVITVNPLCYGYSSRIKISWGATDNTLSYNIWRKNITLGETEFSKIYPGLPANNTDYVDINVNEENSYIYRVEAVGVGGGNTVFSDESSEKTAKKCNNVPPSPSILCPPSCECFYTFYDYDSNGDQINDSRQAVVSLCWTDAGSETGYRIFRSASDWIEVTTEPLPANDDPEVNIHWNDYTVEDGKEYSYKITAFNDYGQTESNPISVNIPIAKPGDFELSGFYNENLKTVYLTWTEAPTTTAGGNVTYNVYRDDSNLFLSHSVVNECEGISSLECDDTEPSFREVFYKVVAANTGGTTDSNILKIVSFLPKWKEIAPF